jgi:hypothetical protein
MLIHIKRNAEVFGPYSVEEAREYFSSGRLVLSDFAQLPGTTEWIPLASVPGVRSALPPPPPPAVQPGLPTGAPQQQKRSDNFLSGPVIRDFLMVLGLQAIGIFIVSLSAGESSRDGATGVSCLLFGTVGFAISGCLAAGNRWEHLCKVAALTMFAYIALAGSFLHDSSAKRYLTSALAAFLIMGLGGALSYLFKRR